MHPTASRTLLFNKVGHDCCCDAQLLFFTVSLRSSYRGFNGSQIILGFSFISLVVNFCFPWMAFPYWQRWILKPTRRNCNHLKLSWPQLLSTCRLERWLWAGSCSQLGFTADTMKFSDSLESSQNNASNVLTVLKLSCTIIQIHTLDLFFICKYL